MTMSSPSPEIALVYRDGYYQVYINGIQRWQSHDQKTSLEFFTNDINSAKEMIT